MPVQMYLRSSNLDLSLYIFLAMKRMDLVQVRISSLEISFVLHNRNQSKADDVCPQVLKMC